MNSTDAEKGMSNNNGTVTVSEDGAYFVVAAGQVGGKVKGSVRIWMRVNGKDVDNSNTEQLVADPAFTTVLVCQGVVELKKGDKVEVMYSGSAPGLGLIAKKPAGEPVVTSIIFSAFKNKLSKRHPTLAEHERFRWFQRSLGDPRFTRALANEVIIASGCRLLTHNSGPSRLGLQPQSVVCGPN
jgi:hypothetical protein